jgi:SAM-dependent methyltransferase
MATVAENRGRWEHHDWRRQGDEWSPGGCAEGTRLFWLRTIRPRVDRFLPAATILEIAPGFGRWTQYLREQCDRLIVVDLSSRCIEACATRFAADRRIACHVNDGRSLPMIADASIDFIFSFDSLVHAEADVLAAYVGEAARILKPDGAGFIHHSNLGAFVNRRTGQPPDYVRPRNWRALSMSAAAFQEQCDRAGLGCRSQELITWIGGGEWADRHRIDGRLLPLTDCLSVFTRAQTAQPLQVVRNHQFVDEWRATVRLVDVYVREPKVVGASFAGAGTQIGRKLATARRVWRHESTRGIASIMRRDAGAALDRARHAIAWRLRGRLIRWFPRGLAG